LESATQKFTAGKFRRAIDMTDVPWLTNPTGVVVRCRLTPKGGRDAIEGVAILADGTSVLMARVRAAPEDGRANRALCQLLAAALGVSISRVMIAAGGKSRVKRVAVAGDPKALIDRLRALQA
jgi:uncharacterized protein